MNMNYNNIARMEDGWFYHTHAWHLLHEICRNIRSFLLRDCAVLDFGAGSGLAAAVIQAIFPQVKVYAVDTDPHCQLFWQDRGIPGEIVDILQGQFREIPKRYDIIICSHVIEHMDEPEKYLRILSGMCRRMIVVVPDGDGRDPDHKMIYDRVIFESVIREGCGYCRRVEFYSLYHPHINNLIGVVDFE